MCLFTLEVPAALIRYHRRRWLCAGGFTFGARLATLTSACLHLCMAARGTAQHSRHTDPRVGRTSRGVNNILRHTITARRTRGCAMGGRSPRAHWAWLAEGRGQSGAARKRGSAGVKDNDLKLTLSTCFDCPYPKSCGRSSPPLSPYGIPHPTPLRQSTHPRCIDDSPMGRRKPHSYPVDPDPVCHHSGVQSFACRPSGPARTGWRSRQDPSVYV